jgi:biopolymer transport protein ExbB/TolQ
MSNDYLIAVFTVAIMVNFSLLVWLVVVVYRLQQKLLELERSVDRNGKDLAGLCTAAVNVDSRLTGSDEQLNKLAIMLTEIEQSGSGEVEPAVHSYQSAIAKIQQGASIDELIQDCGLSHEEAQLLTRLHAR